MKLIKCVSSLFILLFLPVTVLAEARFCSSTNIEFTGRDKIYLTNDVIFDCGDGVKDTILELSKKGWNIRQVIETGKVDKYIILIEK